MACINGILSETGDNKLTCITNSHTESETFIKFLDKNALIKSFSQYSATEAHERSQTITRLCAADTDFGLTVRNFMIPSPQSTGIPVTVYYPGELGIRPTIIVYFHGVGLYWGSSSIARDICCHIAQSAACIVVNVQYRAPDEHGLIAAIEDGICSVRWVVFNKGLLGAKHNSSVGVIGDSGGGLIAAEVAQELNTLSFQILVYPKLTMDSTYTDDSNDGPLCSKTDIERFLKDCSVDQSAKTLERCSPGLRENCSSLPTTLFILAEFDPCKDEINEYVRKLKASKVKTITVPIKGTYHGFFHLPGHFKSSCQKALDRISDFVKSYSHYNHLHLLK